MRYLYCGLTGVRFARSSKSRGANDTQTPHRPASTTSEEYNLLRPSTPEDTLPPETDSAAAQDSTPEQTIARLTAERDAARYERELEADYREDLLGDIEVMYRQLKETQRRLMELEQAANPPDQSPQPGERERRLEQELEEAHSRISQLETAAGLSPPAPLPRSQEGMMDVFLQFVGLQERHDDSQT